MRVVFRKLFTRKSVSDVITIVSGLPRSGTSMMMQMLKAGGMEVVTDNLRKPDEDNPRGYYEYKAVKKIKKDTSWLDSCRGRAVKIVSMLLHYLPLDKEYRIIFMQRDIEEVLTSQRVMIQRLENSVTEVENREMAEKFEKHLNHTVSWLTKQPSIEVFYVNYNKVVKNPQKYAGIVNKFLGGRLDEDRMAQAVQKELYRQRKTGAEDGSSKENFSSG